MAHLNSKVCMLCLILSLVVTIVLSTQLSPDDQAAECARCVGFYEALSRNPAFHQSWKEFKQGSSSCSVCGDLPKNGGQGSVSGDPHFVGAHGTHYDFNGLPGKDYCLFTDSSVHMNMHMIGYSVNESQPDSDGGNLKTVRTWIGKLGVMWKVGGNNHSLVLSAREGPQVERGSGFLAGAELNRVALPALKEGETHALTGGGYLTFHHIGTWGHRKDPMDVYFITLPGLITIRLSLRVEERRWRTHSNAWTHLDVSLSQVHPSGKVHGVLGQTFRKDRNSRSMDFKALTSLLRRPVAADGSSGAGFLDGSMADYETSGVLAPDCRFSSFKQEA